MQRASFWSRVGHWIRPGSPEPGDRGGDDPERPDGLIESAEVDVVDPAETDAQTKVPPVPTKRRQREEDLARLEDGFDRVVNLCDSLNVHFTLQEERSAQIADSLRRVAGDMSKLVTVVGNQSETLQAVVSQLQTGNDRSRRLEELCGHFSKLTEAQRQALAVVAQQVDGARKTDERITESLGTFHTAITTMGNACTESTEALRQLRTEQAAGDERIARLVEQQGKRFVLLFAITLLVAVSGIAGFVAAFLH